MPGGVSGGEAGAGAVFAALSDPTRRAVLRAVAEGRAVTSTRLAQELPVTRQAVAKHLAVLGDAGLVRAERAGRETRYALEPAPLEDAVAWIAQTGARWDDRLARLARR